MSAENNDAEFVCCNVFRPCYGPSCKFHEHNRATPSTDGGREVCKHGHTVCVACTGERGGAWVGKPRDYAVDIIASEIGDAIAAHDSGETINPESRAKHVVAALRAAHPIAGAGEAEPVAWAVVGRDVGLMHTASLREEAQAVARLLPYLAHRDDDEFQCREHRDGPDTCDCGLTWWRERLRVALGANAVALHVLREDARRLDFLEDVKTFTADYLVGRKLWELDAWDVTEGPTLRAAIDAARAANQEEE